jgi:predicted KAP-like P-loop ATPase
MVEFGQEQEQVYWAALVRFYWNGKHKGAGVLVAEGYVLTCAHVLVKTNQQPDTVELDFPLLPHPSGKLSGNVVYWDWDKDIAGVQLLSPAPGEAQPLPFPASSYYTNDAFRVYGFPEKNATGGWAEGRVIGETAGNLVQIQGESAEGYAIEPGFSGAPVWDTTLDGVIGLARLQDKERPLYKVGYLIPYRVLVPALRVGDAASLTVLLTPYLDEIQASVTRALRVCWPKGLLAQPQGDLLAQLKALGEMPDGPTEYPPLVRFAVCLTLPKFAVPSAVNTALQQWLKTRSVDVAAVSEAITPQVNNVAARTSTEAAFLILVPASINNDLPEGKDTLQIEDELTALATVLMLRQLAPPLAVGILGSWGSGKSFAMHLIRQQINTIRSQSLKQQQAWGHEQDEDYEKKLSPYVGHIYQIQFNAWTYARTNLWASLMQEIFYELNRQLTLEQDLKTALEKANSKSGLLEGGDYWQALYEMRPKEQKTLLQKALNQKAWEQLTALHKKTEKTENILWSALGKLRKEERDQLQQTETKLKQKQADLENKQQKIEQEFQQKKAREEKIARWRAFEARLALLFLKLLQVREQTNTDLDKEKIDNLPTSPWQVRLALGVFQLTEDKEDDNEDATKESDREASSDPERDEATSTVQTEADAFLTELKALTDTTRITPFSLTKWLSQNILFCILFVVSVLLLGLAIQDLPELLTEDSPDWALRFWSFLGGVVVILPPGLQILRRVLKLIGSYQASVKGQLERIQKRQEFEREDRLKAEGITEKIEAINQLKLQAEQLRKKVGLTANYDSLMSLVQERLDGKTYSEHLGLMEQVRCDLLDLSDRLTTLPKDPETLKSFKQYFPRGPVRVVLYIDDLDRCPPDRVVEVLETVQLLLKTKLFIVILAIDDRYIARALEQVYTGVLKRRGKPSGIDYLEKIIQIPYRMRPISPLNIESYLDTQTQPRKTPESEEPESSSTDEASNAEQTDTSTQTASAQTIESEVEEGTDTEDPEQGTDSGEIAETAETDQSTYLETIAEVTEFEDWEFQLLVACCKHVDITPRTAKRLINIYKILKIVWEKRPTPERQSPQERERVTISMLALSGRYPDFMRNFFEELATQFEEEADPTDKNPQLQVSAYSIAQKLFPQVSKRDYHAQREWRRFTSDLKRTLLSLSREHSKLSLEELKNKGLDNFSIDYETFHLALSFCFVGDLGYDPDDYHTSPPEPSTQNAQDNDHSL